jgi:hypothetical protein
VVPTIATVISGRGGEGGKSGSMFRDVYQTELIHSDYRVRSSPYGNGVKNALNYSLRGTTFYCIFINNILVWLI